MNLETVASDGHLKDYAAFLYIKSIHVNSCIYNYTQKSLSVKSGMSVSAIRRYVKIFLDKGWCKLHRGNLMFCKLKSVDRTEKKVLIRVWVNSFKDLYDYLRLCVLKIKQRQFNRYKQLSVTLQNSHPKAQKQAQRILDRLGISERSLPGAKELLKISIKAIAKLLGTSVGSAAAFIKKLRSKGKIWCVTSRRVEKSYGSKFNRMGLEAGWYKHGKNLFIVECNRYRF